MKGSLRGLSALVLFACARGSPGKSTTAQESSSAVQGAITSPAPAERSASASPSAAPGATPCATCTAASNIPVSHPGAYSAPATQVNADGDRVPSQWVPSEMAAPVFQWLRVSGVPEGAVVRILMWKVAVEGDSTISSAILWIRYPKDGGRPMQHVLAHVRRFEEHDASWRLLDIVSDYMRILYVVEFAHSPRERELNDFIEHTCWDMKNRVLDPSQAKPENLIDAEVCAHTWRACTGSAPKRSYAQP